MINTVHPIDCMKYMATCEDNQFDLAICDIQYGINQGGGKNKTRGKLAVAKEYKDFGDKRTMPKEYHNELRRITKNQILFGANHFISRMPIDSSCWIIWDKLNGNNDFADCELAWTSFNTAVRIFRCRWSGMLQQNMKNKEIRIHPTQKPVALYKWLLKNYAKPGQTIFDSHVGSGSIRIACHDMGFDFTGCEIDKDYYEAQKKRYQKHACQGDLFEAQEIQGLVY